MAGHQRRLKPPMHPLDHPVGLRVEGGGGDVLDAQGPAEGGPSRGGELGASVGGHGGGDAEVRDPRGQGSNAVGGGG